MKREGVEENSVWNREKRREFHMKQEESLSWSGEWGMEKPTCNGVEWLKKIIIKTKLLWSKI